jgi:hypothetical protein
MRQRDKDGIAFDDHLWVRVLRNLDRETDLGHEGRDQLHKANGHAHVAHDIILWASFEALDPAQKLRSILQVYLVELHLEEHGTNDAQENVIYVVQFDFE